MTVAVGRCPGGHHRGARGDDRSNFLSGLLETDAIVLHCDVG
ncbi:MAG TPA: hypothetical protein VMV89_02380 [Candidatus Paceibacterota bacterium]|nr:hypothetical protein [Candidatus Paceibacterota bacterium]